MAKGFANHVCVYCGQNTSTPTGDHIIPRSFLLIKDRDNIPKVPACGTCNNEKSKLEHYLATILPFGGNHEQARENLEENVPKRLDRNVKLKRLLKSSMAYDSITLGGDESSRLTLPFDGIKYAEFFTYVAKALCWHYWRCSIPSSHQILSQSLTPEGEVFFQNLSRLESQRTVRGDIGGDAFSYVGKWSDTSPFISVWMFSLYGGLNVCDEQLLISKYVGVLIAEPGVIDKIRF